MIGCFFGVKQKASDNSFHSFSERIVDGYSHTTGFKIYPNPIQAGSPVKFEFKNNLVGVYKVEVVDVLGRILQSENFNVVYRYQSITISTSPNWTKGTYLIRLTETKQDSVFIGKLVLN